MLVFKSLGFHTQEIPVQGRMLLNVQMKVSQEELPEVTVTSTWGLSDKSRTLQVL